MGGGDISRHRVVVACRTCYNCREQSLLPDRLLRQLSRYEAMRAAEEMLDPTKFLSVYPGGDGLLIACRACNYEKPAMAEIMENAEKRLEKSARK